MSGEAAATYSGALRPALKVDKGGTFLSIGGAWQDDVSALCPSVAMMALQAQTKFQDICFPMGARLQKEQADNAQALPQCYRLRGLPSMIVSQAGLRHAMLIPTVSKKALQARDATVKSTATDDAIKYPGHE